MQGQPELCPEPVLVPDTCVDGAGASIYGTVLKDGGRFRMWYQAWPLDWDGHDVDLVGYAESNDGLAWHKRLLGLVDYGVGPNHLCDLGFHSPSVFVDPEASPDRRYRATGYTAPGRRGARAQVTRRGYYAAYSADGLHWELECETPQWDSADVITSAYHPGQQRGIVALKFSRRVGGMRRRSIWHAEHVDGRWSTAVMGLIPDEYDDVCARGLGFASGDYYGMGMMPAGSGTVGFVWHFFHSLPRTPGSEAGVFGAVHVSLAYQAGPGERWLHAYGRRPFVAHGVLPWAAGCVYTASTAIDVGDEQWLYFCGTPHTHGWYIDHQWAVLAERKRELIGEGMSRIGLAKWPRDRLFGFRADPEGLLDLELGAVCEPCELWLNYRADRGGHLRVELPGREGYGAEEALPLTGSAIQGRVSWKQGCLIRPQGTEPLRVRLHMERVEVFAYALRPAT